MNTHDKYELPPLPLTSFLARRPYETEFTLNYSVGHMRQYARDAIAPYKQRIAELESQLEAIGAGGVPMMGCQQCTKLKVVLQAVLDDKVTVLSRGVYDQIREALA